MLKRRILDSTAGPATFIAPSTTVVGKLSGQGSYIFCGRIEGECDIDGPVTLAEGGHWQGTLSATDVIVAGTVEGDVVAAQRVELARTARVTGSLCGSSIAVAEGAVIEGDIRITSGQEPQIFQERRQSNKA